MPQNPLLRVCVRLYEADYEKLRAVSEAKGDVGLNLLIRSIIHDYVKRLNDNERRAIDKLNPQIPVSDQNGPTSNLEAAK